ncbi:MAG TPA: diphthine--ammonia ligase [Sphingobacteriaceae bacterium]|nr:diphthine--ammonia ligase [Sphingobacteriaceae bacterium]
MEKAALFWSGGKDCAFALHTVIKEKKYQVETLVTTLNRQFRRISMHGVREEMLDKQAEALQIPILKMWVGDIPTNENYEIELIKTYKQLKSQGIDVIIFGDIFLQDLRLYREKLLSEAGLKGYFPLWKRDTGELIKDILAHGFRTVTCCINTAYLDKSWEGRELNKTFIDGLPPGVDPCGENGEFHTFCFDGPIFNQPIKFKKGKEKYSPLVIKDVITERETGFWFVDILEDE